MPLDNARRSVVLIASAALSACNQASTSSAEEERMAQAMRKVEADQAKSDKLVMEHADAETLKQARIQNAIRER